MRSCAIHVHKHSVEAMLLQQCREVTTVILSITPWLPTYMGHSLIRCNTVLFLSRTSSLPINSAQNLLVNTGSLSEIMLLGKPCSFQIFSRKSFAQPSAVFFPSFTGTKSAILVKRSTNTQTVKQPSDLGSYVMKSMEIASHGA